MKLLPSVIGSALDNVVDLKRGIIFLSGEVDGDMYTHLVAALMALSNSGKTYKELTFILNTYGGDLYQAFAIYDTIKKQPVKTVTIGCGPIMSAGTIILQAGDERIMTRRSYLMYHFGRQVAETQQCVAHFEEVTADVKDLYKKSSKVPVKVINSWFEKETYYNAEQALKLGLVDRISQYEEKKNSET